MSIEVTKPGSRGPASYKIQKNRSAAVIFIVLLLGAVTVIFPFFWMVMTSFDWVAVRTIPFPPRLWPKEFTFRTYQVALTNVPIVKYMLNSVFISAAVILISVSSAMLAGYSLSKLRFKGAGAVLVIILSTMMVPFETTMISQYKLFKFFGLTDNYAAFFLPAITYSFGTFLAKQYLDSLPDTLRDAARIDGANEFRIFIRIYFPLLTNITATLSILQFLDNWNALLWPMLILSSPEKYTVQIGLAMYNYTRGSSMPAIMLAATSLSIVPILIFYLAMQRHIVQSIAYSGLKQ